MSPTLNILNALNKKNDFSECAHIFYRFIFHFNVIMYDEKTIIASVHMVQVRE